MNDFMLKLYYPSIMIKIFNNNGSQSVSQTEISSAKVDDVEELANQRKMRQCRLHAVLSYIYIL